MSVQERPVREATGGLIARATVLAATLTVAGSVLGLARDFLLARFFGATGQTDAFLVAWTIPETASPLLIEGAMTFLMVPIFVRALAEPGGFPATVRATLPRIVAVLALAAAVVVVAAPLLVRLLAPGLAEPGLAVQSMRITAVTVLTFGIAGYLGAALRSVHAFGWSAAIYIAYNVGILAFMVTLHRPLGVLAAAIGVAAGSVLMVLIQAPPFLRRLEPAALRARTAAPHAALAAFIPIGTYTLTRHAQVFVERILGSELSAGTISHLNYAQKVAQLPMVLAVMVATVTFPMLARSMATGDDQASRRHLERDLRVVSALVLVAAAYLVAFATPIVELLFQHGHFGTHDTAATAAIMRAYSVGLLGQAAVGVLSRSYFSQRRSIWYPALVMAAGLAATAAISVALLSRWGGTAIAAGNAAGITLTAALMLTGLRRRVLPIAVRPVVVSVLRLALAAAGAGAAGWVVDRLSSGLPVIVVLLLGGVVVVAVFVLLAVLVHAPEARPLTDAVARLRGPVAVPPVLMYHAVDEGVADPYQIAVTPDRFAQQMRWLERRGLRGTSMRELLDAADRGNARGLAGLTFDDGYAGFVTDVLPILRRHGFGATVYVVAGKLGGCNDWDSPGPVRPLMTAEDVRQAARAGIEIGSHGLNHLHLTDLDADTAEREIRRSRAVLQAVAGLDVPGFCYPYGDLSEAVADTVRSAGYDYAVAIRASGSGHRYALPRMYIGQRDGSLRLWAKWIRHRLRWGAAR